MVKWLDRLALAGIAAGIALMLWPSEGGSFKVGFFVTIGFTVLHIVTSHVATSQ